MFLSIRTVRDRLLSRLRHVRCTIANLWTQIRLQIKNAGLEKRRFIPQIYFHASETGITNNILCLEKNKKKKEEKICRIQEQK